MQLKHFKHREVQPLSLSSAQKLNRFASIFTTLKTQLTKAVTATEPGWYLINLHKESPNGLPSSCELQLLKYQMETAEQMMNELQPKKKNSNHNPPAMKNTTAAVALGEKVSTGKATLSGNVKSPKEQRQTPPTMIAAIVATTKRAWVMGSMIEQQFQKRKIAPSSTDLLPRLILLRRQMAMRVMKTPPPMKPLPIIIRELQERVERLSETKELMLIPLAQRTNRMPTSSMPRTHTTIDIHISTLLQHRMNSRKTKEAIIAATAAPIKTRQPCLKSTAHALYKLVLRICEMS